MNESDKLEGLQEGESRESGVCTDPYVTESGQDIYTTPEVVETEVVVEETEPEAVLPDTHGLFSGNQAEIQPPYGNQDGGYGAQSFYGEQNQNGGYGVQSPYGNPGGGYGVQPPYGEQNQNGGYGTQSPYGNPNGGCGTQPPYGEQNQNGGYGKSEAKRS